MPTVSSTPALVRVRNPMNDHGTVTVEVAETNETRHLVEYDSEQIRDTLASLSAGTRVPVEMVRVGGRANVWRAVAIYGRQTTPADASVSTAN